MKNFLVIISFFAITLISCNGKNSYTFEAFYSENKNNGDTMMVSKKDNITADNDSIAFMKAQEKFNELMAKSGDDNGLPVKFTLRDNKGVIITEPGLQKSREMEKPMYPNQKP